MSKNRDYFNQSISTADEAQSFLIRLYLTGDFFHPEDSPYDIVVEGEDQNDENLFSREECKQLEHRMEEVWSVLDDPCEFMLKYMEKLSKQNYQDNMLS
tara:strand:- start:70 stop:366 length:297 start_codon:yes stop_codon:yes gene_type:complete